MHQGLLISLFALLMGAPSMLRAVDVEAETGSAARLVYPLQVESDSPRMSALAGAGCALGQGAEGQEHNPAGLAFEPRGSLLLGHNTWVMDSVQEVGYFSLPLGKAWGGLGLKANWVNHGSLQAYDAQGQSRGDFIMQEGGLGLAWGGVLLKSLGVGLGMQGSMQSYGDESDQALGLSAGTLYQFSQNISLGLSLLGVGGSAAQGERTWITRAGLAAQTPYHGFHMLGSMEVMLDQGNDLELRGGAETVCFSTLALRGGLRALSAPGSALRCSLGLGLVFTDWAVDYAWLPQEMLGSFHQFSLRWLWGGDLKPKPHSEALKELALPQLVPPPVFSPMPEPTPTPTLAPTPSVALPAPPGLPKGYLPQRSEGIHYDILSPSAGRGLYLEQQGQWQAAFDKYMKGLDENASDAHCWRGLARIYEKTQNGKHAKTAWQRVQQIDPEASDAKEWLSSHP
jgi:hypothetical protein